MPIPSKRVIGWILYLACLMLLGVGVYRFEAHEPRWMLARNDVAVDPVSISADGTRIYTSPFAWRGGRRGFRWKGSIGGNEVELPRKLQVWDAAKCSPIAAYPKSGRLIDASSFSEHERYFASVCQSEYLTAEGYRFVCLVNLQTGEERHLPLPCLLDDAEIRFTRCGEYFVVAAPCLLQLYECATGRLLDERPCERLLPETKAVLFYEDEVDCEEGRLAMYDLHQRRIATKLNNVKWFYDLSADGKFLVNRGEQEGEWIGWNLHTPGKKCLWKSDLTKVGLTDIFYVRDRTFACLAGEINAEPTVELWDIQTGKLVATDKNPATGVETLVDCTARYRVSHSPPRVIFPTSRVMPDGLRMRALPSLKQLWELDSEHKYTAVFTSDGNRVMVAKAGDDAIYLRDCATGQVQQSIALEYCGKNDEILCIEPTKNGRHVLIQQPAAEPARGADEQPVWHRVLQWIGLNPAKLLSRSRDVTIVYDLEANRELLRLRGWDPSTALLSDDGTTLITTHTDVDGSRVLRCWDVGSPKPLRWPLAIPATVGVLLWGLAKGVTRWRTRTPSAVAKSA